MIRPVIAFAALTGPPPEAGVVAVARSAALALLAPRAPRRRPRRCWGALVLAPVLLLVDIWHSPQLSVVHRHPLSAVVGAVSWSLALVARGGGADRAPPAAGRRCWRSLALRSGSRSRPAGNDVEPARPAVLRRRRRRAGWHLAALLARHPRGRRARAPARPRRAPGGRCGSARLLALVVVLYALQATRTRRTSRRRCSRWSSSTSRSRCCSACCATWTGTPRCCAAACAVRWRWRWSFSLHRLRRVRDQDDHPQPQAGRRQRPAHLLHGQLGVLRPRHLRPLPGAGDDPAGRALLYARPQREQRRRSAPCWRCCGPAWC